MNPILNRPKNETDDLLLSITKNCKTLIKQTHREAVKTGQFKLNKPGVTFHFYPSISNEKFWTLGLTSLEVQNSIFLQQKKITNSNIIQILLMIFLLKN